MFFLFPVVSKSSLIIIIIQSGFFGVANILYSHIFHKVNFEEEVGAL